VNRSDVEVLLLFGNENVIVGSTKMQKLAFLVQREAAKEGLQVPDALFLPYKYGPYSQELCDDIDSLIAAGYLESSGQGSVSIPEHRIADISLLEASDFLPESSLNSDLAEDANPDTMDEAEVADQSLSEDDSTIYRLTQDGRKYAEQVAAREPELMRVVETVKARHGFKTLSELLRYVYSKYPDYTTESEIRDQVMGNGSNAH
jgi:hypothetical protein